MKNILITIMFFYLTIFAFGINSPAKTDTIKRNDSISNTSNITLFGQLLGTCSETSLNYQQILYRKNNYSLAIQTGGNNIEFYNNFNTAGLVTNSLFLKGLYLIGFVNFGEMYVDNHYYQHHIFLLNRFSYLNNRILLESGPCIYYINAYEKNKTIMKKSEIYTPLLKLSIEIAISKKWSLEASSVLLLNKNIVKYSQKVESDIFMIYPSRYENSKIYSTYAIGLHYHFIPKISNSTNNPGNELYTIPKNSLYFNFMNLGFGYERVIFGKNNNYLLWLLNPSILPYKRFEISEKRGVHVMVNSFINYVYKLNKCLATEVGVGYSWNYSSFSIFDDIFSEHSYKYKSNIGLRINKGKHILIKINYSPTIYNNFNYNLEHIKNFHYMRINLFSMCVGYSFGKK